MDIQTNKNGKETNIIFNKTKRNIGQMILLSEKKGKLTINLCGAYPVEIIK